MELLNNIPLVGIVLGLFLLFLILISKGGQFNNRKAKLCLASIIFLNVHLQFDSFLYYNGLEKWIFFGFSFLFYHAHGALFYLYTQYLFKSKLKIKWWGVLFVAYSLFRVSVVIHDFENEDYIEPLNLMELLSILDNYISILLNIIMLLIAYLRIKRLKFAIQLSKSEQMNYNWIKGLLIVSLILYIATFQSNLIMLFQATEWLTYMKIETLIQSFFFFAVAFYAIRFPVFAVHGDFTDMEEKEVKKYAKSSLKEDDSMNLWNQINQIMVEEKLYSNPEYRLNDLAERVGKSLHHVSQVINEREGISYTDFVNAFRIKEAQKLLVSPEHSSFTILAIAYGVGFNSKTAFYNAFKKQTGLTPTQFKKQA